MQVASKESKAGAKQVDNVENDAKRLYLAVCQAADRLSTGSESLQEPELSKYVNLVEQEGYTVPTRTCRCISSSKAKIALKEWWTGGMAPELLNAWVRIATPWLEDGETMEAWDIKDPQFRCLPATDDLADADDFTSKWASCMFNDVTNTLVKQDADLKDLSPLLSVLFAFVDKRNAAKLNKWKRATPDKVRLCIENVCSAFRGMIGCVSPIPRDRNASPEDVEFFLPQLAIDIVVQKRKKEHDDTGSMAAINQASKIVQFNAANSKLWRALRADYKAKQSVDMAAVTTIADLLQKLSSLDDPEARPCIYLDRPGPDPRHAKRDG